MRDRAWYFLAKIRYQRGIADNAFRCKIAEGQDQRKLAPKLRLLRQ